MCKQCDIKPVYEFTNKRKLCKNCFLKWFQKKVLYTIRKYSMIKKDEVVFYPEILCKPLPLGISDKKTADFRAVVLEDILKMLSEKGRVKIKTANTENKDKIISHNSADFIAYAFVKFLINKEVYDIKKFCPVEGKVIRPFCLFLDKEILLYAKLKKLKFRQPVKKKKDFISEKIDDLEKKHPEIKRAIVSSALKLYCL